MCDHRERALLALNVRTNHVHGVVTAMCKPEPVLGALKACATRALHRAGLIGLKTKPWAAQPLRKLMRLKQRSVSALRVVRSVHPLA